MNSKIFFYISLFLCFNGTVVAECSNTTLMSLSFIVEHAVWLGWHQTIIQTPGIESDCHWALMHLVKCLGLNGIASALNVSEKPRLRSSLGIVIFAPNLQTTSPKTFEETIHQMIKWEMNTRYQDWLIVIKSAAVLNKISGALNASEIRFDQNVILALPDHESKKVNLNLCRDNFIYSKENQIKLPMMYMKASHTNTSPCKENSSNKTNYERIYYRSSARFRNISRNKIYKSNEKELPLFRSGVLSFNFSSSLNMVNFSNIKLSRVLRNDTVANFFKMHVIQCFKVRTNSTLFLTYLGAWSQERSMSLVEPPYPVEARNFMGETLIIGRCNTSSEEVDASDDVGPTAPELLIDILQFLTSRLNATSIMRYYSKLGFRTYEGVWTGLLGALIEGSVDIALEPVTAMSPRHKNMDFVFPIAETMCNIYIRHQETSAVRDIFLAPFSAELIACVLCVGFGAAITIVIISRTVSYSEGTRRMTYFEALIWSTGILCQQGGSWTPSSSAASVLLIVCLFFALVTYNAYAAFITSVLSVRVASVGSLSDVLQSNFKIGYVRNGADQMYLMSTKDVQLNAFYIRGYSNAENLVSSAEEGLERAAKMDYAFFAGQRIARSTLRETLSQARGRCALRELPVPSTRAHVSFPLPSSSPYSRPVLVSLLQLRSGGILRRLEEALVPAMPQCSPPTGFASARAADVQTAFFLLLAGLFAAMFLGFGEYLWNNRNKYTRTVKQKFRRVFY